MKTFQKSLIAAALVAGSFAAVAGTAGTTNLLFPYVTTQTGSYTFISILNQDAAGGSTATPLHFTYATKGVNALNSASCAHVDGDAKSTANDLMQFEIQNKVDLAKAFGDTTSVPKFLSAAANDQHGMLIVNNDAGGAYGTGATYRGLKLYGEARIINTVNGVVAAYSTDDLHTAVGAGNPNFADASGPDGAIVTKVVSWFAEPAVTASWLAIPLGTEQAMAFAPVSVTAKYSVKNADNTTSGHYNNNEEFQSANAEASVTCFGQFSRKNLLGDLNAAFSNNGGWGNLKGDIPSVVYKVETTNATGPLSTFVTRAPTL